MRTFQMESVITHWHCADPTCKGYGNDIDWPVSFFQNVGTPVCKHCDEDMILSNTVTVDG